jgi:hypothetical protein
LTFDRPTIRLVKHGQKFVGQTDLLIDKPKEKKDKPTPKVSEMFRLRRCAINDAQVVYEDDAHPDSAMTWKAINVNLDTTPQSPSEYQFKLGVQNEPLIELSSHGSFDIDALSAKTDQAILSARASVDGETIRFRRRLRIF